MIEIFKSIPAGGTVFNSLTVLAGSLAGLFIGKFIPQRLQETIFNCLGLFTMYVGINMTLGTKHSIAVLLSLVTGTITGDMLGLEIKLNSLGDTLKAKLHTSNAKFTQGFVTATLLFCIGSMAIIGAFNDGLRHDSELLMTKGIMDGIASVLLAGSMGFGVIFSVIPMFIYQGALTFFAVWAEPFITPDMYANISGLGGLMIMGIGLNMLKITRLKLGDMLPALIYVIFFTVIFS
ncbi:MAG: DUF554 domain-containing protein [Synergistaceae bacterium]|nr:DUF554 domain-containing protein [Synergistaceae bacterium]MBQ3450600.1 DUF554 domain-containing protein [Synergistaceae bacterium]MBQ6111609.1 DUF554 domain-containing protein [Synergistaceae bacterium]MBQ9629432.1 DUF554 domain-containing protein [Synergistaceae bacterium]